MITIDSVVDELRTRGATTKADEQPLTRSAFDNVIQTSAGSDGPVRIIPTLLQAISRERAGQMALESLDPVWGDPSFDAFQMLLVYLGIEEASRRAEVAGVPIAGVLAAPRLMGIGSLVEILEFFWDGVSSPYQMLRFSTCAQIVGGFATVLISWSPQTVWHRDGTKPDTANLEATLTMAHQFSERESAMLELLGCLPPQPGGIGGKSVRWYLDGKASAHGSLTQRGTTTDPSGNVQATYQTVAESAPLPQRTTAYEKKEMVAVNVQVQDLLNDFPKFTAIYRTLLGTSTLPPNLGSPSIDARFEVRWYEPKAYTVRIEWTEKWKTGKIDEGTFNGRLDTPEECFPAEHDLCLGGTGTVSGHRGGWQSCNPGIQERPQGSGAAEFHATIDGDEITLTAFAGFLNPLAGMTTVPITVPSAGGHYTGNLSYGAYCGSESAIHSYTYDLTLTPLTAP